MYLPRPVKSAIYALAAFRYRSSGALVPARVIADRVGLPLEQAAKLLQDLSSAGLLTAQRGRRGGYRLARSLDEICIADVFRALGQEPPRDAGQPGPRRTEDGLNALDQGIHRIQVHLWQHLERETIGSLVDLPVAVEPDIAPTQHAENEPEGANLAVCLAE